VLFRSLLQEGDSRLVDPCLDNPRLQEGAVFRFVASSRATAETISAVARHARWKTRPALRLALLKNPKTPLVCFVVHLPALGLPDLKGLLVSRRLTGEQKKAVDEEMRRREKGGGR